MNMCEATFVVIYCFIFLYKLLKKVDVNSYCIFNQDRKKCVFHL